MYWHLVGTGMRATGVEPRFLTAAECSSWCCCTVRALSGISREGNLGSGAALLPPPPHLARSHRGVSAGAALSLAMVDTGWLLQLLHTRGNCSLFSGRAVFFGIMFGIMFQFEVLVLWCKED